MKVLNVSIKGISPLLQHRFPMDGADKPGKKRTGVPDWQAECERALYKDEKGVLYEPASHLESALAIAGRSFKISGRRGATYGKLVASTISIEPDAIPHKITHYEVDSRPVVVQKARIVRYRPRFDNWELDFRIAVHDEQLPLSVLKEILDQTGLYVGIGDYRPGRGGKFGKFMVTKFEEVK